MRRPARSPRSAVFGTIATLDGISVQSSGRTMPIGAPASA